MMVATGGSLKDNMRRAPGKIIGEEGRTEEREEKEMVATGEG